MIKAYGFVRMPNEKKGRATTAHPQIDCKEPKPLIGFYPLRGIYPLPVYENNGKIGENGILFLLSRKSRFPQFSGKAMGDKKGVNPMTL